MTIPVTAAPAAAAAAAVVGCLAAWLLLTGLLTGSRRLWARMFDLLERILAL